MYALFENIKVEKPPVNILELKRARLTDTTLYFNLQHKYLMWLGEQREKDRKEYRKDLRKKVI